MLTHLSKAWSATKLFEVIIGVTGLHPPVDGVFSEEEDPPKSSRTKVSKMAGA